MKVIIKRELKNYFKNSIYYVGILLIFFEVFQIMQPYLKLHYWESDAQVEAAKLEHIHDADVMDGYFPSTEKEQIEIAMPDICRDLNEDSGISKEETDQMTKMFLEEGYSQEKILNYLAEHYDYMNADYYFQEAELRQGTAEEVNAYMDEKFSQMRYSEYFARKYTDFAGLFFVFFSSILMAFLFLQDTRKNTYELLHTKPVSAWQYVTGKIAGGFTALLLPLAVMTAVFTFLCMHRGREQGFPVAVWDVFAAAAVYVLPNLLMVICVYALTAFLFKNPLPATPLLILYMVYIDSYITLLTLVLCADTCYQEIPGAGWEILAIKPGRQQRLTILKRFAVQYVFLICTAAAGYGLFYLIQQPYMRENGLYHFATAMAATAASIVLFGALPVLISKITGSLWGAIGAAAALWFFLISHWSWELSALEQSAISADI